MISAAVVDYLKKGVFTILGLMLAVYLFVILMTYTGNDPSWSHISSDMTTINNMGGAMGAWLSDLLYSFFGFGAWWLLVFMIYESILIWWDNKPTFWILRLVAYVFLLLSASALFAQLVALIQHVADPVTSGLKGVAGGIIGLELQARLALLLTKWGSVLFLSFFVVITATFAFNIHWLSIYHKLTALKWLGSGISEPSNANEKAADFEEADSTATVKMAENKHNSTEIAPEYEQLPLELQTETNTTAPQNTSRFSHVLTDFLVKSGLGASVKEAMANAEAAATNKAMTDNLQPATANGASESYQTQAETVPANIETNNKNTPQPHNKTNHNINDEEPLSLAAMPTTAEQVDDLADAWLAEHTTATIDSEFVANEQTNAPTPIEPTSAASTRSMVAPVAITEEPVAIAEEIKEDLDIAKTIVSTAPVTATPDASQSKLVDMTPTNTPPSNPKQAPKAQGDAEAEPVTAAKPTVSFAVPDGDASNHITDMMPEDNSPAESEPVMPDIHDDEAFTKRSRSMQTAQYRSSLSKLPELSILDKPDPNREPSYTIAELEQLSELLEIKLQEFNVKAEVVQAIPGPVVTRFEVDLAAGIKASKVTGISRDLARSLSMASLRVVEVIPGKPYIGIEVPNKQREMVRLIELLNTDKYKDPNAQISMAMGKDIGGKPIITDLARAPHMLVAGTTGSGKSVLVNSMLLSMLLKYTPNELRLILIDPKQLELANYNDIPHLLTPVVTDMTEAASALSWCVAEMERRYQLMSLLKVRKLNEFNKKVIAAEKAGKPMLDPLWRPNDNVSISQAPKLKTLPMIVIVADEFADMIMQVGKQAEELITRLAQKSRASGIHLMLATQRPSVDVITGLIKANIPVRAALRVNSKVDSRTILDSGGAEDMLGNGDMLFLGPGQIEPDRVHGAYVSDEEVNRVCDAWRERGAPDYIDNMAGNFELSSSGSSGGSGVASGEDDDLYNEAVAFIMETRKVSASSIQRKFSIGYNRAARIVDSMEEAGLVSSMGKSGKRELLM
ncbi:DNA translocase FtsK 4TM domain-containing protein [Psychrobacter sp. AH5]|uniref:DNA translocase FtsK n=1 Tax=Psychrobacter sp. AH5 TaxID=2937433 RepID=UPI00333E3221